MEHQNNQGGLLLVLLTLIGAPPPTPCHGQCSAKRIWWKILVGSSTPRGGRTRATAQPTKPTRSLTGRSGSNCRTEFVAASAFQVLNTTTPTTLAVHLLSVLSSLPIPAASGVRQSNFETALADPVNEALRHWPNVGAKSLMQPTGLHVHKKLSAISASQVCDCQAQTILFVSHAFVLPKWLGTPIPHFRHSKAGFSPTLSLHFAS